MTYMQPPAPPLPPAPPPPAHAPKRPWWKALWFVALVAGIVGVGIGAAGGGTSNASKPGPTVTATATVAITATPAVTVTATPTVVKTIATRIRTAIVTYTPPPKPAISDGTYKVGTDINPGQFRTDGVSDSGVGCYWERESNLSGGLGSIIANDNIDGPTIIQVNRGEYLKLSGGCEWRHV